MKIIEKLLRRIKLYLEPERTLIHISVGNVEWVPTQLELEAERDDFLQRKVYVTKRDVQIERHKYKRSCVKAFVTAGTYDWQPTTVDLHCLREYISDAILRDSCSYWRFLNRYESLVVTRNGVALELVSV